MIKLSVALPLWDSREIAWLCLESLCRQKVNVEWELLIMEEEKNAFGLNNILTYSKRLEKAGCASIRYFVPEYQIPLSVKWRELGQKARRSSKVFVFCSGDDFYEPTKLKTAYDMITAGHDWVGYRRALMFDIPTKRHIQFDCTGIQPSGNIIACKTSDIKAIQEEYMLRGVDSWLFRTINPKNPMIIDSDSWKNGFATDGFNTLSKSSRQQYYSSLKRPFSATTLNVKNIIPANIYDRLTKGSGSKKPTKSRKKQFKVVIVSAVWKRPEVFEMFAKGIHELENIKGLELITIISGSEGEKSRNIVEKHGFQYIEIENQPLAQKVSAPVLEAKKHNVDYILGLGSDDIISIEVMMYYLDLMKKGYDFVGSTDFYFYHLNTGRSAYWGGYREPGRKGFTVGAGRLMSKNLLNSWNWKPWENKDSENLDHSIQEKLKSTYHSSHTFSLKEQGLFAVDIKSDINKTPFKLWDNTAYIDSKIITDKFPYVQEKEIC